MPRLLTPDAPAARVLLSHRYFAPDEARERSLDRLRRQLDWLRTAYHPIGVPELLQALANGTVPDGAIVVTTDDALLDVFDVAGEFRAFEVPLAIYACVGWIGADGSSATHLLASSISSIEWFEGPDAVLELSNGFRLELSTTNKPANIDRILAEMTSLLEHTDELHDKISALKGPAPPRTTCNWAELQELTSAGVYIGAHSVSHVRMAQMSPTRQRYEVFESKSILETNLGSCTSFAYPFGTFDTYDGSTRARVKDAGFGAAFLSHSDIVMSSSDPFALPRITLPDAPIPLSNSKRESRAAAFRCNGCKG